MAEHYRVFIFAGQSNMDGRGKKSDLTGSLAPFAKPRPDVLICYSNSTIRGPYTSGGWKPLEPGYSVPPGTKQAHGDKYTMPAETFGPEVGFGNALADAWKSSSHIAIIKFSEGGTSLHKDWDPNTRGALYDQMMKFVDASLKTLPGHDVTWQYAGFVWHQGESDASLPDGKYQELLEALIARVRNDLHTLEMPVVIGEVFNNAHRDRVLAGQKAACDKGKNVFLVSAKGLVTSDHGTHFDTASQIELGKRMAKIYLEKAPITAE